MRAIILSLAILLTANLFSQNFDFAYALCLKDTAPTITSIYDAKFISDSNYFKVIDKNNSKYLENDPQAYYRLDYSFQEYLELEDAEILSITRLDKHPYFSFCVKAAFWGSHDFIYYLYISKGGNVTILTPCVGKEQDYFYSIIYSKDLLTKEEKAFLIKTFDYFPVSFSDL